MRFGGIDLGPALAVLCFGVTLLLATRLVEIYARRRAARRARDLVDAARRADGGHAKKN